MAEERDVASRNKGKITCDRKILLSIINLATKEISGISRMAGNLPQKVKNAFTKNTQDGVRIKFKENGALIVDVYIYILYGFKVPDIAYRVQENIKNSIAAMVDMQTSKVNVHILGVEFEKDEENVIA